MFHLPIGEVFETFVRSLKENLDGFFDTISGILDFAITVLERTLALEPTGFYPSVLFAAILGIVVWRLAAKRGAGKSAGIIALAVVAVFGLVEVWRIQSLQREINPEVATGMTRNSESLREAVLEIAPDSFQPATDLLNRIDEMLPESGDRESKEYKMARTVNRSLRAIRRARPGDFDAVFAALNTTVSSIQEFDPDIPSEVVVEIEALRDQYAGYSLIEEMEGLTEDYADVEEAEAMIGFFSTTTYEDFLERIAYAESALGDAIGAELAAVKADILKLNPNRLGWYGPIVTTILLALVAWLIAGQGIAIFSAVGFLLIVSMDLWDPTIETLALVLSATLFALVLGIPLGILAARSKGADHVIRPILDFMQTMPAFVYLIPAVIFFGLGPVPGAMATLIFAMPPAVRLTSLGIRQVPEEVVEAAESFGSTEKQLLFKAQIPIALPTILAGVNQTIMLALSMVVIGGMIGAGGLGEVVLGGITRMNLGLGFEGGLAVVVLAIFLDRVTQKLGAPAQ